MSQVNKRIIPDDCRYTFALKWSPDRNEYNIHGLWPTDRTPSKIHPEFCMETLRSNTKLYDQLLSNWNSDLHKKHVDEIQIEQADIKFWKHEWDKHGVYSGLAQNAYFLKANNLYLLHKKEVPVSTLHHQLHFYLKADYTVISSDIITI